MDSFGAAPCTLSFIHLTNLAIMIAWKVSENIVLTRFRRYRSLLGFPVGFDLIDFSFGLRSSFRLVLDRRRFRFGL